MKEPSQKEPDRKRKSSGIPETPSPQVDWDDSQMASSYANVVNAHSSREEVTLFFGTHGWKPAEGKKVAVKLSNRLILNPLAYWEPSGKLVIYTSTQNPSSIRVQPNVC